MLYGWITKDETKISLAEHNMLFRSWSLSLNCFQSLCLHIFYSVFLFGFNFQLQCFQLWFKIIKYLCSFNLLEILLNLFQELVLRHLFLHLSCQVKQWNLIYKKHIFRVLFCECGLKKKSLWHSKACYRSISQVFLLNGNLANRIFKKPYWKCIYVFIHA